MALRLSTVITLGLASADLSPSSAHYWPVFTLITEQVNQEEK